MQEALADAVSILSDDVKGDSWTCRVVRIDDKGIYINAGLNDKIEKNDVFAVVRLHEPIKDQATSRILGYKQTEIAKIKITEVLEKNLSLARPFDMKEAVKEGDLVSAKRIRFQEENEINRWNEIFGNDASKKQSVSPLESSGKLAKRAYQYLQRKRLLALSVSQLFLYRPKGRLAAVLLLAQTD